MSAEILPPCCAGEPLIGECPCSCHDRQVDRDGTTEILTVDSADRITITGWRCDCGRSFTHGMGGHLCPNNGYREVRRVVPITRSAVIVVDGEPCPGPPFHGFHGPGKDLCSGTHPPEQVRRLTEPCQTFTLHQRCCDNSATCSDPSSPGCCWGDDGSGVIDLGDGWVITDVVRVLGDDESAVVAEHEVIFDLDIVARPGQFAVFTEQEKQ